MYLPSFGAGIAASVLQLLNVVAYKSVVTTDADTTVAMVNAKRIFFIIFALIFCLFILVILPIISHLFALSEISIYLIHRGVHTHNAKNIVHLKIGIVRCH